LESGIYPIPNPAIDCSAVGTSTDITTSPPECFARVSFSPLPGNSVGSYTVPEGMAIAGRKLICLYISFVRYVNNTNSCISLYLHTCISLSPIV